MRDTDPGVKRGVQPGGTITSWLDIGARHSHGPKSSVSGFIEQRKALAPKERGEVIPTEICLSVVGRCIWSKSQGIVQMPPCTYKELQESPLHEANPAGSGCICGAGDPSEWRRKVWEAVMGFLSSTRGPVPLQSRDGGP